MRRSRRSMIVGIVFASLLMSWIGPSAGSAAPETAPASAVVNRFGGSDSYETAIAVSKAAWADGAARAVVLARGDEFPDALSGVPLAAHTHAPLLITPPAALRA